MSASDPAGWAEDEGVSRWRTLQYLALTRVLVAVSLLLSLAAFGSSISAWTGRGYFVAAAAYCVGAGVLAVLAAYVRRRPMAHVAAQIAFDLILISALMVASGGLRFGLAVLYLLPLAGASLLLPTVVVFSVCSLVVITVLLDTFARTLVSAGSEASLFQAGLYGVMMFAITALLRLLAQRLSAQERLARQRGVNLHNQLAINRLVIAQLEQGVVVVDAGTRVRANNRSARLLFGMSPEAQLTGQRLSDLPQLAPVVAAFDSWLRSGPAESLRRAMIVELPELRLRVRLVRPAVKTSDEYLIFIEDLRALDERAQQLKLASMGRLTASIAHEIRNPLAAISHASQLLLEDARDGGLRRLASIVRENTLRLNRLVDDILRVARREAPAGDDIALAEFLREWLAEFERDRALAPGRVTLSVASADRVRFEQSHLRQVLYNLLDNALRYASAADGAVRIVVDAAAGETQLWVLDDGPGVGESARSTLFEPFNTTYTKGTGLGLYIAREFCLANRCDLTYGERALPEGGMRQGFAIRFAVAAEPVPQFAEGLDTIAPYE